MIDFEDQEAECGVELLRSVADFVEPLWGKKTLTEYRWHVKAITGRFLPIELLRIIARVLYPWAHQLPYALADSEDDAAGGTDSAIEDAGGKAGEIIEARSAV